jgi:ketosteroid isomerase-like protein
MSMTDEDQLREMQALWGQYHADKNMDAWGNLFTEDALFVNPRRVEVIGRATITKYMTDINANHPPDRYIRHVFSVPVIKVTGDSAEMSADYASCQCIGAQPAFIGAIGRHISRLVRRDGRWLFSEYRIVNPYE